MEILSVLESDCQLVVSGTSVFIFFVNLLAVFFDDFEVSLLQGYVFNNCVFYYFSLLFYFLSFYYIYNFIRGPLDFIYYYYFCIAFIFLFSFFVFCHGEWNLIIKCYIITNANTKNMFYIGLIFKYNDFEEKKRKMHGCRS